MKAEDIEKRLVSNAVFMESFATQYSIAREEQKSQVIEKCNELVYKTAQEYGISVYEVCANFVPEVSSDIHQPQIRGVSPFDRNTMSVVTTIKLKRII